MLLCVEQCLRPLLTSSDINYEEVPSASPHHLVIDEDVVSAAEHEEAPLASSSPSPAQHTLEDAPSAPPLHLITSEDVGDAHTAAPHSLRTFAVDDLLTIILPPPPEFADPPPPLPPRRERIRTVEVERPCPECMALRDSGVAAAELMLPYLLAVPALPRETITKKFTKKWVGPGAKRTKIDQAQGLVDLAMTVETAYAEVMGGIMTTARDVVDERTGEHQADDVTIRDMMLVVNERLFRPQSEGELVSFIEVDVADDPAAAAARAAGTVAVRSVVREASPMEALLRSRGVQQNSPPFRKRLPRVRHLVRVCLAGTDGSTEAIASDSVAAV